VTTIAHISPDEGGEGRVILGRPEGVSAQSVWFLVDTATGRYLGATPSGERYDIGSMPPIQLRQGRRCTEAIVPSHEVVEVLLVRPTERLGVWQGEVADGAPADQDGATDGLVHVCVGDLQPVEGEAAAPSFVQPGDTLIAIDSETFECRAAHVGSGF
jgi:hypothetical protein